MKNYIKKGILGVSLLAGIFFTSCDNDDNEIIIVISEERAAEVIASSMAYNTYGLTANIEYISFLIDEGLDCNEQITNTDVIQYNSVFDAIAYIYTFTENYSKECQEIEQINYAIEANENLDALYFQSQEDIVADFDVQGIDQSETEESFSGRYERDGDWHSKIYHDTLIVDFTTNLNAITIDKTIGRIVSGTSTFDLTLNYSESTEMSNYTGNVVFLNSTDARIDFENGASYLLNIETGHIELI